MDIDESVRDTCMYFVYSIVVSQHTDSRKNLNINYKSREPTTTYTANVLYMYLIFSRSVLVGACTEL